MQVTHSEANAAYGSRTIQLRDGWLVGDTSNPALEPDGEAAGHDEAPIRPQRRCGYSASVAPPQVIPSASDCCAIHGCPSAKPLQPPFRLAMPHSHNPMRLTAPDTVPEPQLANSPRLDQLIRDGKLYMSLQDAIDLALENNLDLAIARYNLPIANTDILRTKAGGYFRGVNTGVVQGTPGGGVGGFGTGAPGRAPAARPAARAARAQARRAWCNPPSASAPRYRPTIPRSMRNGGEEHQTLPLSNLQIYGVPSCKPIPGNSTSTTLRHFPPVPVFPSGSI